MEEIELFWFGEVAKVLISTVEISAIYCVALSLYRFPLRHVYLRVILICFLVSCLGTYLRDLIGLVDFAPLIMLVFQIVLTVIFLNLPIFYSTIISITTIILSALFETTVIETGNWLGIMDYNKIVASVKYYYAMDLIVSFVSVILIYILQSKKLGFTFMVKHSSLLPIKGFNFLLCGVLIIFVSAIQVEILLFTRSDSSLLFPLFNCCFFIIILFIAYRHNRKQLEKRYSYLNQKSKAFKFD
jgi:hypothetical protein